MKNKRIIHNNLLYIKMKDYIISTKNIYFYRNQHHFILIFLQNKFCNRADIIHDRLASFKICYALYLNIISIQKLSVVKNILAEYESYI